MDENDQSAWLVEPRGEDAYIWFSKETLDALPEDMRAHARALAAHFQESGKSPLQAQAVCPSISVTACEIHVWCRGYSN
jgi:hypothetical protein